MGIIVLKNMEKSSMKSRKINKKEKKQIEQEEDIEDEIVIDERFSQKNKKGFEKKKAKKQEISSESEQEIEEESEIQEEEEIEEEIESESKSEVSEEQEEGKIKKDKYFSKIKFDEFDLNPKTLQSLNENNFYTATEIQAKTIPLSLSGADIMGAAKTGSGKSLSFLIPAVEVVIKSKHLPGTKVLIMTPTRELALQLYNLAKDLLMYHKETCALIIGGANRKVEAEKLKSGASIIIATPGRLLDHMKNTKNFIYQNNCMLIIDEADAILRIGFEQELKDIIHLLPKKRQSLLFSATMSSKLDDIIRLSLKNPIQISTKSEEATVSNLEQGYVVIDPQNKFLLLYTFLKKNQNKKIIVFFSSCKEVEFYTHLLNYVDVPVKSTHGGQKQQKRTGTFFEFTNMDTGILLCTDVVQRGLDFPDVDWIIQYDPPHNPEEYIHRVGRTARGADGKGKALLILLKSEIGLVRYLKAAKVNIKEFDFPESRLLKIQEQFEKLVNKKDHFLLTTATEAYRAYLHSYIAHTIKDVFDINNLDLSKVCKSFGLVHPPMVNLNVRVQSSFARKKKAMQANGGKNHYSKGNMEKKEGDTRQFQY